MVFQPPVKFGIFKNRRQKLIARLKEQYGVSSGVVMVAAGFEMGRHSFRQESSFYYLTGLSEPAAILCMYFDGREILYIPRFSTPRGQWVQVFVEGPHDAAKIEVTEIRYLGKDNPGYFGQ